MGPNSDKLSEIYCVYSFFEFKSGRFQEGIILQRKATKLIEEAFGQLSAQYVLRLHEQTQMLI